MSSVLFYLATIIVVFGAYFYKKFAKTIALTSKLAGPTAYPLVGNGLIFINKSPAEFLLKLEEVVKDHGKCFRLWLATQLIVFMSDPKDVEVILSSQKLIDKSDEYDFIKPWLGDGLLISSGKKWHSRRKIITPTFHFKILEEFVEIFDKQSNTFVKVMQKYSKTGETFDIFPFVTLCALDVICETAMGTTKDTQYNSESDYVKAVKLISYIIHVRTFDFLLRYNLFFKMSSFNQKQKDALKILHGYTDNVIMSRREELIKKSQQTNTQSATDNDLGIKKKMAFLDVLLQSNIDGKPLTNLEIREEVDTFMFEGHDTTTSAISFALYQISQHPEVQQKIVDEIREVIGDDVTKPVTLKDLSGLNYLELVIKETLRLYPSVPMMARKIFEDIEINGKMIPAGANVVIGTIFMGRDADNFEDPLAFKPERFDVERSAEKSNPYQYVPFSAGPRNCIGQKFAMAEMKSLISKVLRHYEILPPNEPSPPVLVAEMILRPENGIKIRLQPRVY